MKAWDKAYLAGLLDGEGHVRLYGNRLWVQIGLKNCDDVLNYLKANFGGNVYDGGACRRWIVTGREAHLFFRDVEPYLRIKKDKVAACFLQIGRRLRLKGTIRRRRKL